MSEQPMWKGGAVPIMAECDCCNAGFAPPKVAVVEVAYDTRAGGPTLLCLVCAKRAVAILSAARYQVVVDGTPLDTFGTEAEAVESAMHECRNCLGEDPPVTARVVDTEDECRTGEFHGVDGVATAPDPLWDGLAMVRCYHCGDDAWAAPDDPDPHELCDDCVMASRRKR